MIDGLAGLLTTILTLVLYVLRSHAERRAAREPAEAEEAIDATMGSHEATREAVLLQSLANRMQRRKADVAAARQQRPDPDDLRS